MEIMQRFTANAESHHENLYDLWLPWRRIPFCRWAKYPGTFLKFQIRIYLTSNDTACCSELLRTMDTSLYRYHTSLFAGGK
jgi:hypothetical protein